MSFLIAAPASGSGKTTITLGLLRALVNKGIDVEGAKSGPDYIDPAFHAAACGHPCLNLDAWAMTPTRLRALASGPRPLIIEGAMGLYDAAANGAGSAASLAKTLSFPIVLVIDARRMSQSVAALVHGFKTFDPDTSIAGVILNNVGSARHETILRAALPTTNIIGVIPHDQSLQHPSRHLGLVQAGERDDLAAFLDRAASLMTQHLDFSALPPLNPSRPVPGNHRPPPAQTIAIAQDVAFAFCYPHLLQSWQNAGATLKFFSPLNDDAVPAADLVYLPGGYPELHAGRLSENDNFMQSLRFAAQTTQIYGECGGYMTLGTSLTDANGTTYPMAGLLDLETSFASPVRHLGYRHLQADAGPFVGNWRGHEFHYASTVHARGTPLFAAKDAFEDDLPPMGLIQRNVSGSFAHIIDQDD